MVAPRPGVTGDKNLLEQTSETSASFLFGCYQTMYTWYMSTSEYGVERNFLVARQA